MKILIRVGIVGAILLGGLLFRDRLTGNAGDLKVGDCFDVPTSTTNIKDVQHHPCTESHTGEVVFVGVHPAAKATPFSQKLLLDFAGSKCVPAFQAYTGTSAVDVLELGAFYPVQKDWDSGDRGITCYLYRVDGSALSKSLKKT